MGTALAPIPFSAIDGFARRYGVTDVDEFDRLRRLIGAMDRAFLEDVRAEQEAARNTKKPARQ